MWFSSNKSLLDILCDSSLSFKKKDNILKKKEQLLKEIDSLSEERLVFYLFNTRLPKSIKKVLCERIDALGIIRGKKAVDYFLKNVSTRGDFLNSDLCPNLIKKAILTDLFGLDYEQVIVDKNIPIETRYLVIDLCLSSKECVRLLNKTDEVAIKDYIIEKKVVTNQEIKDVLGNLDVKTEVKNTVIDRKIDMSNIFELLDHFFGEVRSSILTRKARDIYQYI